MRTTLNELIENGQTPLTRSEVDRFRAEGHWTGSTVRSVLTEATARYPDREALVGYRTDGEVDRWTYRELDQRAHVAARRLAGLGVRAGETVAVMLPNWVEYPALMFGIDEIGCVYTGIPVSYGSRQAASILRTSGAAVVVIPRAWRRQDHLGLMRELREGLPNLRHIIVLDADTEPLELRGGESRWKDIPEESFPAVGHTASEEICYLGFTSGTTGEPKGAMHSAESMLYSVRQLAIHFGPAAFGDPAVQLVVSPTGHHTGYVWGVLFTAHLGGTGVHVDHWNPAWGIDIIRGEFITTFVGAPTFLQDMMRTDLAGDPACPLTCLVIAGSPVPRSLPRQASEALGAYIAPAWGMTECSVIASCTPAEPDEITMTDGSVFAGSEMRVVDLSDQVMPAGVEGGLQVKGPALFAAYKNRPDATSEAFTSDAWFRTGDTAEMDEHGWVVLRGRTKDIIIRGGENIPVVDIETLLFQHPDVVTAAVVGVPDDRLGERVCAVLVLASGAPRMDLPTLSTFLLQRGLSTHYLPQVLVLKDELPMTQSGKIQKVELRAELARTA